MLTPVMNNSIPDPFGKYSSCVVEIRSWQAAAADIDPHIINHQSTPPNPAITRTPYSELNLPLLLDPCPPSYNR